MATSKTDIRKPVHPSPKEISYFVVFGDSLSDGKNMGEKFSFLGSLINGLWDKELGLDKSPKERFTNGYTWADVLRATLISKFINEDKIKKNAQHRFGKYNLDNADISDDVLYQSPYQRKRYTSDEVEAESNEVKRKKHTKDRDEAHLFAAKRENTPENAEKPRYELDLADTKVAQRYKKNIPDHLHHKALLQESSDDISDKLISDSRYRQYVQEYYSLDNGRTAQYNGRNFFTNYSQGGATSYDYSWSVAFLSVNSFHSLLTSIKLFFTRLLVSNLSKQVKQFLADSEKQEVTGDQKEKTLITIFSGANDLITANSDLTKEAADRAVQSNIDNIEKLIKKGYKNFVLCNLPDLSLTPRFQNKSSEERSHAQEISNHFNEQLRAKFLELQSKLKQNRPDCSIDLFNINEVFSTVYNDVLTNGEDSKYHEYFDKEKLKEPYIDSPDYEITSEGTSPGAKHMFWDDVHPTATMHALLMAEYYKSKEGLGKYKLSAPPEQSAVQLCRQFKQKYHEKLKHGWFSFLNSDSKLPIDYKDPEKALITILRYALDEQNEDADFVRDAMSDLGWWVNDEPNMCIPALSDAMWIVDPKYAQKLEKLLDPHLTKLDSSVIENEPLNTPELAGHLAPQPAKLDSSGVILSALKTPELEEQSAPHLAKGDSSEVTTSSLKTQEDGKKEPPRIIPPELRFADDVKERLKKLQDRWDKEKEQKLAQPKQDSSRPLVGL
ncbi:SGNH/GDSL hydrolase family protein [Fluoribacter gormanii]|uniref:GDSL-like Lipase/Acylhydrolase n=1 Tax=Fluoribacter gormanii TaxID=464 RepID=A0A377GIL0_9GAMM|nr:SGNH/GDSL hydrolase family protein [Fluoribacter gormanii]KTD03376.1 lipolytic enzyme, GDSL family [Fluoribacter gormanii]SIQ51426.1 GDSL-like Lipase/Acylhydrolase [Fluoribacter gormanii]STO24403.1 Secreted effector protein sseJ [Fluoribacter gormanii]